MGELGWYGLQIPEEYGGSGGSFLDATLFLEEFTRGQIPVAGYGVTLIVVGALNRFGTEEQKREHFGHVVKGGTLALALSEPASGSDIAIASVPPFTTWPKCSRFCSSEPKRFSAATTISVTP